MRRNKRIRPAIKSSVVILNSFKIKNCYDSAPEHVPQALSAESDHPCVVSSIEFAIHDEEQKNKPITIIMIITIRTKICQVSILYKLFNRIFYDAKDDQKSSNPVDISVIVDVSPPEFERF